MEAPFKIISFEMNAIESRRQENADIIETANDKKKGKRVKTIAF